MYRMTLYSVHRNDELIKCFSFQVNILQICVDVYFRYAYDI